MENKDTVEVELADGTIARWVIPADKVDAVTNALESILGQPETLKA